MKVRVIVVVVALFVVAIGVWRLIEGWDSPRQVAAGLSMELAREAMGPSWSDFKLRKTSFLDSFASDRFYVVLDFQNPNTGNKLQEVFFFDASDGKPRMEWSYSVLNSLAKLKVNEGTFVDDGNAQIQQKGREFELPIALTPVEWNVQGETIERLGREGVEMLVSLKEHPDLKALRIETVTNAGCLAEFQSMDDALDFAKILGIKLRK